MMTILRLVSQKHSQWPPKSFRLCQAWELMLLLSFLGCLMLIFMNIWFSSKCTYFTSGRKTCNSEAERT
ncbi:hypothetical protein ACLB2K_004202 [Fragaria x ananassa]